MMRYSPGAMNAGPDDDTEIKSNEIGVTILHTLGVDPPFEHTTRTGRPVSLVPYGAVLENILS